VLVLCAQAGLARVGVLDAVDRELEPAGVSAAPEVGLSDVLCGVGVTDAA